MGHFPGAVCCVDIRVVSIACTGNADGDLSTIKYGVPPARSFLGEKSLKESDLGFDRALSTSFGTAPEVSSRI